MKTAAKQNKARPPASFEEEYRAALLEYVGHAAEEQLGRAYELGRRAMADGKSLMEIASIHDRALEEMVRKAKTNKCAEELLKASAGFLTESLSPYEMANRGFQDAVKALRQLNETLEEEIKRIAHAVHDDSGQMLVAVHLALQDLGHDLPKTRQEQIRKIKELLKNVESQLRRYSHELRPTVLDDLGLIPAIRFLADGVSKRTSLPIEIKAKFSGRLPSAVEIALYRIVQEALTNATKHAQANRVWIEVYREDRVLLCSILDDGVGFDVGVIRSERKQGGLGLIGMQERLNAIGGTLSIVSAPGKGTKIVIRLPMENSNGNSSVSRR